MLRWVVAPMWCAGSRAVCEGRIHGRMSRDVCPRWIPRVGCNRGAELEDLSRARVVSSRGSKPTKTYIICAYEALLVYGSGNYLGRGNSSHTSL